MAEAPVYVAEAPVYVAEAPVYVAEAPPGKVYLATNFNQIEAKLQSLT